MHEGLHIGISQCGGVWERQHELQVWDRRRFRYVATAESIGTVSLV